MEAGQHVINLKVKGPEDIARIAAAMAIMGQPVYILHFTHNGKHIYGMLAVFHDYYKLHGIPIFYYIESDKRLGNYFLVKANEVEGELVEFGDTIKTGWTPIPVLNLEEKPPFIKF